MMPREAIIADENVVEDVKGYLELEKKDDDEMKQQENRDKQIANLTSRRGTQQINRDFEVENPKNLWDADLEYYHPVKEAKTEKRVRFAQGGKRKNKTKRTTRKK